MTSTSTSILRHITNAPDGIVRVWAPEGIDVSKRDLRNFAAHVAKTIDVGRTPAGKGGVTITTPDGTKLKGVTFDFAPVKRAGSPAAPAAPAEDPRIVTLVALGFTAEQAAAVLGMAPAASGKGKGKGTAKPKAAVPSFITDRAKARDAAAKACDKCLGFGKVRSTPRPSGKYPHAFRTLNGAATAPTGVPCPKCHGAAKTA